MSFSPNHYDRLIAQYLARVQQVLHDLPKERRDVIVDGLREHIQAARSAMAHEDEAAIRQMLEDLGDPTAIRAESGLPPLSQNDWGARWAPWLLLLGGFIFFAGWFAGVVLLWNSSAWSTRDKIVATLIWPGGLAAVFVVGGLAWVVPVASCIGSAGICSAEAGPSPARSVVTALLAIVLIAAPILVSARLIRIQRSVKSSL
ncbi:MAG: hypothetical protein M1415_07465 [Firmicutes bacterium]|jgi:hypothetical protein|nr:hypothetical protein [Bacillota bacterium]